MGGQWAAEKTTRSVPLVVTLVVWLALTVLPVASCSDLTRQQLQDGGASFTPAGREAAPIETVAAELSEEQLSAVGEHLDNARDYERAGQFGLALVELDQALATAPRHEATLDMYAAVAAKATAQIREANAAATATEQRIRAQATAEAQSQATATVRAGIVLDVPNLIGKTGPEIRAQFGAPQRIETVRAGSLQTLPEGGEAWRYSAGGWFWEFLMNRSDRVAALLIDAIEDQATPRDFDDALRKLGLPVGQRPTGTDLFARWWNNLAGYYVSLGYERTGRIGLVTVGPRRE